MDAKTGQDGKGIDRVSTSSIVVFRGQGQFLTSGPRSLSES